MRVDVNDLILCIRDDCHVALAQGRMLQDGQRGLVLNSRRLDLSRQIPIHHLLANLSGDVVAQEADLATLRKRTEKSEQRAEELLLRELRTLTDRASRFNEVDVQHGLNRNTSFGATTLELNRVLIRSSNRVQVRIGGSVVPLFEEGIELVVIPAELRLTDC